MKKFTLSTAIVAASLLLSVGLGVFAVPTVGHAELHVLHEASGLCVVPRSRGIKPGTKLVLHSGDCFKSDSRSEGLDFRYDADEKRLIHVKSGLCATAEDRQRSPQDENTRIVLDECYVSAAEFTFLRGGYLRHVGGQCAHARGGGRDGQVGNDTDLVLHTGCHGERLVFTMFNPATSNIITTPPSKIEHRYSGLCAMPQPQGKNRDNTKIILTDINCNDFHVQGRQQNFVLLPNGAIKHVESEKCVHPDRGAVMPGNNTPLVIYDGCHFTRIKFRMLTNGAIQHESSGKCIHPYGGYLLPGAGTGLVLYDQCDAGKRIEFDFVREK